MTDKRFIAWDGEGENIDGKHRLILLANSEGDLLLDKQRQGKLTYVDWLPFLTQYPHAVNVWYSFQYDVNMIFKDLPENLKILMFQRQEKTPIVIDNDLYTVKYIPRKILTIKKNNQSYTHYDTFGFFQTSFLKMLKAWNIPIPEIIEQGKELRADFTTQTLDFITRYNFAECEKLAEVVTKLHHYIQTAGITELRSWHGAGAIASRFLKDWAFESHKTNTPTTKKYQTLFNARKYSYMGGHSELYFRGLVKDVYQYDINSAYPSACRFLPSLYDQTWYHTTKFHQIEPDHFGILHVKWKWNESTRVGALPFRMNDNTIIYPRSGEGWYHNIEIQAAIRKGYKIQFIEAWILKKPYTFFLANQIEEMAAYRLKLKKKKDLGNIPIKLGLNALYGKIAQKPIRREDGSFKYGNYTDLFLAGYITAHTRAMMLDAMNTDTIIMAATDGIFSSTPLDVQIGEHLGQWEYAHHKQGIFLLSGNYALQDDQGEWHLKTRGYTNMEIKDFQDIYQKQIRQEEVKYPERRFISIKLSLRAKKYHGAEFETLPRYVNWNNNKKRIFKFIEADASDSLAVDRPLKQPHSKMYNPYVTAMEILTDLDLDLSDSIGDDEL